MIVDINRYNDETLDKVRAALRSFDPFLDDEGMTDIISSIQNAGILFRESLPEAIPTDEITDGYHTFGELYAHRRALTAALAAERADIAWKSKAHHPDDGPMFEGGYFIVGIDTPAGTVTYHYKLKHWDDFGEVVELDHAPKWDGATPDDTIARLLAWAWGPGAYQPVSPPPPLHVQDAANPLHPVEPGPTVRIGE